MSNGDYIKHHCVRESDNHYVLPRMGSMQVDVHAYLSDQLFERSEGNMWVQAQMTAQREGVTGVYLMPDCHVGYGIPVGGVVVTDDLIIQSGSGYDVSCGIVHMRVPGLHASDVSSWDKRDSWIREMSKRVAFGIGHDRPAKMRSFDENEFDEILHYGAKALGVPRDRCERQYIKISDNIDARKIEKAYAKGIPQLGSTGGGNHYVELQVDRDDGSVWVMIHCGSRGFGYQIANHFFYEGAKHNGIPIKQRESSALRIDDPIGREYWEYHNMAANYAIANRHVIVDAVQQSLQKVFKAQGEVYYEISHNLVQQETLVLPDGTTKKGFVHRKGATRAFPAGHPELVGTKWEETGHPCLIPGSMYDGAAILFPKEGAYKTACSVNHGSGRVMGRGEAKRRLKHDQRFIDDQMRTVKRKLGGVEIRGIVGNTKKTPLDECCKVYKNLDDVLAVLDAEGIASIDRRLYPVANMKGTD